MITWLYVGYTIYGTSEQLTYHHQLSFNHEGRWGTTDDFTTTLLHGKWRNEKRTLHNSLVEYALWGDLAIVWLYVSLL